jgi:hypothetical protein
VELAGEARLAKWKAKRSQIGIPKLVLQKVANEICACGPQTYGTTWYVLT